MNNLFLPPDEAALRILESLPEIVEKTFPVPLRFRAALPRDVSELSGLLTSQRELRGSSYLGKPSLLSAYLRYFMPWNIYRLCRLLSGLPIALKANDTVNDLGAGPLTFVSALWISRPGLRNMPLEFRCLDKTMAVMEAGKKFFNALIVESFGGSRPPVACPWVIKTIRGEIKRGGALSVELRGKKAALSAAVNLYNELFWELSPGDSESLEVFVKRQAHLLSSLTDPGGSILVMEPGIPRSGEFISLLRSAFIKEGRSIVSPCTHEGPCPMPGGKAKWCHFAFDTGSAPMKLHKLSAAAGIPKERAVASFLLAGSGVEPRPGPTAPSGLIKIRSVSDCFPLNGHERFFGRYGCCEKGLVLVKGSKKSQEAFPSGALKELPLNNGEIDIKSGAKVAELNKNFEKINK